MHETLFVDVVGGAVQGEPPTPLSMSTASCTSAATPSSRSVASNASFHIPVQFAPVVPALLLILVLQAVAPVVAVPTSNETLYPAEVTLRMNSNSVAHN